MSHDREIYPKDTRRRSSSRHLARRSRKGCPECRKRKIKCDEDQPECGQCKNTDRSCSITDSLFKQHAYSFGFSPPRSVGHNVTFGQTHVASSPGSAVGYRPMPNFTSTAHDQLLVSPGWQEFPPQTTAYVVTPTPALTTGEPGNALSSGLGSNLQVQHAIQTGYSELTESIHTTSPGQESASSQLGLSPVSVARSSVGVGGSSEHVQDEKEIVFFMRLFVEHAGQWYVKYLAINNAQERKMLYRESGWIILPDAG